MGFINPKDAHALQSATDTEAAAPALITVLMKRGYSDSDLKKILGENTLRVVREVAGG